MSGRDTGGPAFPAPEAGEDLFGQRAAYTGMDLRDYFAARAMNGLVASCTSDQAISPKLVAGWAYEMADAMLKARDA